MGRTFVISGQAEADADARRLRRHGHVVALVAVDRSLVALTVEAEASLDVVECLIATAPSARPLQAVHV